MTPLRRWLDPRTYVRYAARQAITLRERRRDTPALLRWCPDLACASPAWRAYADELRPAHAEYVSSVSTPEMAISLPLAVTLRVLCDAVRPASVLDLGSGFSSYVFRRHLGARVPRVRIVSVDTDPAWLDRTREFLRAQGLDDSDLITWDSLAARDERFDLVLHDIGWLSMRQQVLGQVLARANPHGVVVLDDVHLEPYFSFVRREVPRTGRRVYTLERFTRDEGRRYSMLVMSRPIPA